MPLSLCLFSVAIIPGVSDVAFDIRVAQQHNARSFSDLTIEVIIPFPVQLDALKRAIYEFDFVSVVTHPGVLRGRLQRTHVSSRPSHLVARTHQ